MKLRKDEDWGQEHELYRSDLRSVDLGLAEDKLERAVRMIHIDYLQLDQKSRKAVLVLPSLLPTPIVEIALKVLFNHYAQPPSVVLWTSPMLACVGAGVRNGLVIDIGWEETVVAAIGEYKEVAQRRTTRAGKQLTREMAKLLEDEANNQLPQDISDGGAGGVTFEYAEQVTRRMAWCRSMTSPSTSEEQAVSMIKLPSPWPDDLRHIHLPFNRLSRPSETTFVTEDESSSDDHNLSIPKLAYRALLSLPLDLRTLCISRILIVGGPSHIPGLKTRVLQELSSLVNTRGWDVVNNYGSATAHHSKILQERSANIAKSKDATNSSGDVPLSPAKKPIQDSIPHATRIHDDVHDPISRKVDAEMRKGKAEVTKAVVRGVETLGAWAGASLVLSLRVKGVCEVERDEFLKNGLNDEGMLI
jgi:actin-related protein